MQYNLTTTNINLNVEENMPPKAWFRASMPGSDWNKVELGDIEDIADLKKTIQNQSHQSLGSINTASFNIKATKYVDDPGLAIPLSPQHTLKAVLKNFAIDTSTNDDILEVFAKNICLFVDPHSK